MVQTVTRRSLVDQAIDQLREAIGSGAWPVGHRIPPEPELIASLGVARNTMREAVRALAHAGVLDVRHGDGTYVRARNETEGVLMRRVELTPLLEVVTVRRGLEVEAARQAAERRTPEDLTRLTALSRGPDVGSLDHRVQRAVEFHTALVDASHNPLLVELYHAMAQSIATAINRATADPALADVGAREHEELLAAVTDQTPGRAAVAAARHLAPLIAQIREQL